MTKSKIKVECLECGKKFQTTKTTPQCPRCNGVDIDVREPVMPAGHWASNEPWGSLPGGQKVR